MRRSFVALVLTLGLLAVAAAPPFGDVIPLPNGFFPEGIAVGEGTTFYTGSLADGAIWRGDLRSGDGSVLVPGVEGKISVGMDFDRRSGHLHVAGGGDGNLWIYDGATGDTVDVVFLASGGFVNDVIVTRGAAYLTDSFLPQIYSVPLGPDGAVAGPANVIPLTGDFQFEEFQFNANGIEATANGKTLIVVNSFFGEIYTVDPASGHSSRIDLGGATVAGDGLVLTGRTLYAVEGFLNQVTEVRLSPDLGVGTVTAAITDDDFDVPTTAARFGSDLYVVNAKFTTPPGPDVPYEVVRVDR